MAYIYTHNSEHNWLILLLFWRSVNRILSPFNRVIFKNSTIINKFKLPFNNDTNSKNKRSIDLIYSNMFLHLFNICRNRWIAKLPHMSISVCFILISVHLMEYFEKKIMCTYRKYIGFIISMQKKTASI